MNIIHLRMMRGPKPELWESRMYKPGREFWTAPGAGKVYQRSEQESPEPGKALAERKYCSSLRDPFLSLWPETLPQLHSVFSLFFVGPH